MLKFISFGSGSCGNCYYLGNENGALIIDAGIGIRCIRRSLRDYGIAPNKIRGMLITHNHADHVKAVGNISAEYNLPVYTTALIHNGIKGNCHAQRKISSENVRIIEKNVQFNIGDFKITAFDIPHDSTDNVCFKIESGDGVFTIMTDIGCITENVQRLISESNYLVIEANYDHDMLERGRYSRLLKDRITCGKGHISNIDVANNLREFYHKGLKRIWLCHLSEENNHPDVALKTIEDELRKKGLSVGTEVKVEVLRRKIPTGPFEFSIRICD